MMIAFCNECGKKMKYVMHFEEQTSGAYFLCKTCNYRTKPKKIIWETDDNKKDEVRKNGFKLQNKHR